MVRMVPRNQQRSRSCKNLRARFQGRERCRLLGEGLERGVVASPSTLAVERVGVRGHPTITVQDVPSGARRMPKLNSVFCFSLLSKVLSQQQEAEIGYSTAVALADVPDSVICWDYGGSLECS